MITIFRKLRNSTLTENRIGKYLLYALGEIILVVIGILIALQLNTLKEQKKNSKIETSYLQGISNDLDQDIFELTGVIDTDTSQFASYTLLLRAFTEDSVDVYSSSFLSAISDAQFTQTFDQNSIVFEDMKSSGKINVIKSDDLRFALLEYYQASAITTALDKKSSEQVLALGDEAFSDNVDMNSLVEKYLFEEKWSAELDPLDMSFFKRSKDDVAVKKFAQRISLMKAISLVMLNRHEVLLGKSVKLKEKVQSYLNTGELKTNNDISKEVLRAIRKGDVENLEKLVALEGINTCFDLGGGSTYNYLAMSVKAGNFESFKFFIDKGADIDKVCRNKSPLMYAAKYGEYEMAKYLITQGADIDVIVEGKTALDFAVDNEDEAIIELLNNEVRH